MHLGTLTDGLGCFPLDHGTSLPQSDSCDLTLTAFGVCLDLVSLWGPLVQPVLYLRQETHKAIPKYISEKTRYHRV